MLDDLALVSCRLEHQGARTIRKIPVLMGFGPSRIELFLRAL